MIKAWTVSVRAACRRMVSSNAARIFFAVGVIAGCVAFAHVFGYTLCPMKRWLGVPCPTCGTTRAFVRLLHGDVGGAFALQPLVMGIVCLLVPAALAVWMMPGARCVKTFWLSAVRMPVFWLAVAAALLANWVYVMARGN